MENKTSSFSQFILWFGAAVSIAEILTGALLAPLGFNKGIMAILIGHIIGAIILFLAGKIGAQSKLSSIESTRISFGTYGSYLFSVLNIIQLLGWTAIMILSGAQAFNAVTKQLYGMDHEILWSILIGLLIMAWIAFGAKQLTIVNTIAVGALFIFTIILGVIVFSHPLNTVGKITDQLTFGAAVELNVTMSLSWLPLIADYTKHVKKETSGTLLSVLGYFIGSILMYAVGLGASLFAGTSDISTILLTAGLGLAALFIVVFSTVTTTFLDAFSAGISFQNINKKVNGKTAGIVVTIIGVFLAMFVPMTQYENFLYFIGSVFAPLFAIVLTDFFILKKKSITNHLINIPNLLIWIIGVFGYRALMPYNSIVGITLPVMIGIGLLSILINGGIKLCSKKF